jgi:hypothetical protein
MESKMSRSRSSTAAALALALASTPTLAPAMALAPTLSLGLALSLAGTTPISAHSASKGANGGPLIEVGKYHTELVVDGSTKVVVFVSDVDDKPIPATGFKATAILVVGGKSQRIELTPAEGSKLVGTATGPVAAGVKGVLRLTAPDGSTAQGKY